MSSDRWSKIEEIYHAALKLEENRRASFLDQACQGDEELRREVESLLASDAKAADFIESPAVELLARAMTDVDLSSLIGRQLGIYQILSPLGAGGMGEVYRARDTRLNRTVAIKILSRQLAERADLRQRFEREAHALASLNHPNIASIYGLEESSDLPALVMELVEGPTLGERIAQGPIPIDEALPIARQIAEALEYAHEKGMFHRDLKPANLKLTAEGVVKVLDFGLAKVLEGNIVPGNLEDSSTLGLTSTQSGIILGTAAYMAPEQARGSAVDKRADIWSFGVVLYEMLTGKRLFGGETVSDTMASVLKAEPNWDALPEEVPAAIRKLLRRCLTKDRRERLQAIGEARIEIAECLSAPGGSVGEEAAGLKPGNKGWWREQLAWVLAGAFLVAAIVGAVSYLLLVRAPASAVVSGILPPEKTQFNFETDSGPALSPDGRTLAFSPVDASGKTMLWVRPLDSTSARLLPGTEGADHPFWSADSRAIGFFAVGKLKTIEASGGPVLVVGDAPGSTGGSWNREGTILFAANLGKGLYLAAGSRVASVPVIELDVSKHSFYSYPHFLPDGKHFLYWAGGADPATGGIYFASLDGKENRILMLVKGGDIGFNMYASGFLLYIHDSTLMAQSFDPERGLLKGDLYPVAERVILFDVSQNGVLVYQQGEWGEGRRLAWFDRAGKELDVIGDAGPYFQLRFSPEGSKLAFDMGAPNGDIWVEELERGVRMRLTNDPETDKGLPVWSPEGRRILYGATSGRGRLGIYQIPSNGVGGEELLLPAESFPQQIWPTSWSPDGKFILYSRGSLDTLVFAQIWVLPLVGDRRPRLFMQTPVASYDGQFSPDGRWVAYSSKESGREEVYVVPFDAAKVLITNPGSANANTEGKWQISANGGSFPRWRRDSKEIFYLAPGGQMMAVEVAEKGNSLEVRKPVLLFKAAASFSLAPYDVAPDGKRFIINTKSRNDNTPLTLVVNWMARLGH